MWYEHARNNVVAAETKTRGERKLGLLREMKKQRLVTVQLTTRRTRKSRNRCPNRNLSRGNTNKKRGGKNGGGSLVLVAKCCQRIATFSSQRRQVFSVYCFSIPGQLQCMVTLRDWPLRGKICRLGFRSRRDVPLAEPRGVASAGACRSFRPVT